jgi:glycosyltransferase involved in cell wall biosynthesis
MSGDPTFSVVMPAYNSARTIRTAIASVLAQTRADLELIVFDDGSTDGTAALVETIAAEDPRLRLVGGAHQGLPAARNTGIAASHGQLVSFLDSDDLWMPGYLEAVAGALEENPAAGFAYTDAWVLHDRTKRIYRRTELESRRPPPPGASIEEVLATLASHNFLVIGAVTVRRPILDEVGMFDPSLKSAEDYDLWLRIVSAGHSPVFAPGTPLILRDHASSMSKDDRLMSRGFAEVLRRLIDEYEAPETAREIARAKMRRFHHFETRRTLGARITAAVYSLRLRLTKLVNRFWRSRYLRRTPPTEVAAAFPDLSQL